MTVETRTAVLRGTRAETVNVEVDVRRGLPVFQATGLPRKAAGEVKERVRAALSNSGFDYPMRRITVNCRPQIRGEGDQLDLAVAVAILVATGQATGKRLGQSAFIGQLALDGRLVGGRGGLALVLAALETGNSRVVMPAGCVWPVPAAAERLVPAASLREVIQWLERGWLPRQPALPEPDPAVPSPVDLAGIIGQEAAKRALTVSLAGGHHLLLVGPPGLGKSMLGEACSGLLPELRPEEAVEVTAIHNALGLWEGPALMTRAPVRRPPPGVSAVRLLGGGKPWRAGELALAHRGVLLMDDVVEARPDTRQALLAAMEPYAIGWLGLPAEPVAFTMVASANPCPCGHAGDLDQACTCVPREVRAHQRRLSAAWLDRVAIGVYVNRAGVADQGPEAGLTSREVREAIAIARGRQANRYQIAPVRLNGQVDRGQLLEKGNFAPAALRLVERAAGQLGLSVRRSDHCLRVARTIADLAGRERVEEGDTAEALGLRPVWRSEGSGG
ncbi:MAG: ATP-binding protein [Bacillota bacterium]